MLSRNAIVLLALTSLVGCTENLRTASPTLLGGPVEVTQVGNKESVAPGQAQAPVIQVKIVLKKQGLFDQDFLYGSDIQYSSVGDNELNLFLQSLAVGHIPVRFFQVGTELHLIADNRRLFPSDVNHPNQLISRFQILAETADTLTVTGMDSRVQLARAADGATAVPVRDHWLRSFEFDQNGNYFLQETSIMTANGSIVEFMETIFPRQNIQPSPKFVPIELNPSRPDGGLQLPLQRFRFLSTEATYAGERLRAFAQKFDIYKPNGDVNPIEWWVTPNIPDEYLEPVQLAVESWNRYFRQLSGIQSDVVKFKGRLPQNIKLGDPRYNVINWDSRRVAGAAYESQASDPLTGKQSHSLVYMPAAWLSIGENYWRRGQTAARSDEHRISRLGGAKVGCFKEFEGEMRLLDSGRLSTVDPKTFGIELMKGTLMHEIGHALGLAHNFKGSLSFDRSVPNSIFSSSIMDYNQFEIERAAFNDVHSAEGPALEYDRQILSALYNSSQNIGAQDPVLPVCNDEEADFDSGGIDPLCLRYDIEAEPSLSVVRALRRLTESQLADDVSLSAALLRAPDRVAPPARAAAIGTPEELKSFADELETSLVAPLEFFLSASRSSLAATIRTNAESLLVFLPRVLRPNDSERAIRERVFTAVESALALRSLPAIVRSSFVAARDELVARWATTPAAQSLSSSQLVDEKQRLANDWTQNLDQIEKDDVLGLGMVHARALGALVRNPDVPLYFGEVGGARFDFETAALNILQRTTLDESYTPGARRAGARTLKSYIGRSGAETTIVSVRQALRAQLGVARDTAQRELLESMLLELR